MDSAAKQNRKCMLTKFVSNSLKTTESCKLSKMLLIKRMSILGGILGEPSDNFGKI